MNKQTETTISLIGLILGLILAFFALVDIPKRCKLSLAVGSDILCPAMTPTFTPNKQWNIQVDASKIWQESGIEVNPGDHVTVKYISGTWGQDALDAKGHPDGYICSQYMPASKCTELVPDAIQSSLIGKVGTQILKIGDYLEFTVNQHGFLQFSKNQDVVGFNLHGDSGIITIQVTITG